MSINCLHFFYFRTPLYNQRFQCTQCACEILLSPKGGNYSWQICSKLCLNEYAANKGVPFVLRLTSIGLHSLILSLISMMNHYLNEHNFITVAYFSIVNRYPSSSLGWSFKSYWPFLFTDSVLSNLSTGHLSYLELFSPSSWNNSTS